MTVLKLNKGPKLMTEAKAEAIKTKLTKPTPPTPINFNVEVISANIGKTANAYIDRALVSLETIWDPNYEIPEGQEQKEEIKKARLTLIASLAKQSSKIAGTRQSVVRKVIAALTTKKQAETALVLLEQLVKKVGRSAFFEHSRFMRGKAVNADVAAAEIAQLEEALAMVGKKNDHGTETDCVFEMGEDTAPEQEYQGPEENPTLAESEEDCELAALEVQAFCSAYWRLMTKNKRNADLLPFKVAKAGDDYVQITDFAEFIEAEQKAYNERRRAEAAATLAAIHSITANEDTSDLEVPDAPEVPDND